MEETTTGPPDAGGAGDADFLSKVTTSPSAFLMTMPLLFVLFGSWNVEELGAGLLEVWLGVCAVWLVVAMLGVWGCARVEGGRSEGWDDDVRDMDMAWACGGPY